jgi:hypothetical protein
LSTERRHGGKENLMNLSLRNLFTGVNGHAPVRTYTRPALRTRLQVERLEGRELPTAMIAFYNFPIYNAAHVKTGDLYISKEIGGQFWGTFWDFSRGLNFTVSGQLKQVTSSWDTMTFQGSGGFPFNYESVQFNGWMTEIYPHWMVGTLTQNYQAWVSPYGLRIWSTSTYEVSLGSPPIY